MMPTNSAMTPSRSASMSAMGKERSASSMRRPTRRSRTSKLEEKGPKIFVNLSISQIAVINPNTRKIEKWKLQSVGTNFPMALDEPHRRLFVAARKPARLLVLDMDTGKEIASLPGAADTDDMWFDATRKRIY